MSTTAVFADAVPRRVAAIGIDVYRSSVRSTPVTEAGMRMKQVALLLGMATLYACTTTGAPSSSDAPIVGRWSGAHAELMLTDSGGTSSYDCAHGGLYSPVVPNGAGDFDVLGVHVRERGGPARIGEVPDSLPARFIGQLNGDRMRLRVLVGTDTLGPFELQLGAASQLVRCL